MEYSWWTTLWRFQVPSKATQPSIYVYPFSPRLGVDYLAVGQGHETGRGRDSGLYLKDWALQTYELTCHREVSSDTSVFWAKWSFAYSSKRVGLYLRKRMVLCSFWISGLFWFYCDWYSQDSWQVLVASWGQCQINALVLIILSGLATWWGPFVSGERWLYTTTLVTAL